MSHAAWNKLQHALHGNGDSDAEAMADAGEAQLTGARRERESPVEEADGSTGSQPREAVQRRRSSRVSVRPVDPGDVQAQLASSRSALTRPITVEDGAGRMHGRLNWGGHIMTWRSTETIGGLIPEGVDRSTTLSYIMCPLIADALDQPEWYPAAICPRPEHLGTVWVDYPHDDVISPGGSERVLSYDGPSWAVAVDLVRASIARLDWGGSYLIARLNMPLHWPTADQHDCVRDVLVPHNGVALVLWNVLQDYAHAVLNMRRRRDARLRVAGQAERAMSPGAAANHLPPHRWQEEAEDEAARADYQEEYLRASTGDRVVDPDDDFCRGHIASREPRPDENCIICMESLDTPHYHLGCVEPTMRHMCPPGSCNLGSACTNHVRIESVCPAGMHWQCCNDFFLRSITSFGPSTCPACRSEEGIDRARFVCYFWECILGIRVAVPRVGNRLTAAPASG